jgi:secreted trypsin-like serine protease
VIHLRALVSLAPFWLGLTAQTVPPQVAPPLPPSSPVTPGPEVAVDNEEGRGRIVGGRDARPNSALYQVEIYSTNQWTPAEVAADTARADSDPQKLFLARKPDDWERDHRCGGALISKDWIVTAGHCVTGVNGGVLANRRVRLGSISLLPDGGSTTYRIERVVIHNHFTEDRLTHDIALIRIVPDSATRKIDPRRAVPIQPVGAKAGIRPLAEDDPLLATGWGATGAKRVGAPEARGVNGLQRMSPTLKELDLSIAPDNACTDIGAYAEAMATGGALCVSALPGTGDCNGDSGGPLVRPERGGGAVLVGLVSQGRGCAQGKPSLYTKVSAYVGWIERAQRMSVAEQVVRR